MYRLAVLVGRADPGRQRVAERWLAESHERLASAAGVAAGVIHRNAAPLNPPGPGLAIS